LKQRDLFFIIFLIFNALVRLCGFWHTFR